MSDWIFITGGAQRIGKAIADIKKGKIDFKVDKNGIVHASIGKVSFDVEKISENTSPIRLESIQFCHNETAKLEVEEKVVKDGYCIVPIENYPDPY